ncbi:hypothetical protein ACFQZI_06650 [Mucilaginibacter lutimaris]|uniref:Uncharacterized protein n=1 Tax=Mucilaginibacter lutimaris TaxID=931629 RepID=A0ABW2ZEC1_9SPHI
MKKLIIPAVAIALAFGTSAFKATTTTSNFFKYIGPSARTSAQVQDLNNYAALDVNPCIDNGNVCGVTLTTAKTIGQAPASSEFNVQKANLWSSQQSHTAANAAIGMEE